MRRSIRLSTILLSLACLAGFSSTSTAQSGVPACGKQNTKFLAFLIADKRLIEDVKTTFSRKIKEANQYTVCTLRNEIMSDGLHYMLFSEQGKDRHYVTRVNGLMGEHSTYGPFHYKQLRDKLPSD